MMIRQMKKRNCRRVTEKTKKPLRRKLKNLAKKKTKKKREMIIMMTTMKKKMRMRRKRDFMSKCKRSI